MRLETKKAIKRLGYKNYKAYLLSDYWRARKQKYFLGHPRKCWICKTTKQIHLHHASYDQIGREMDKQLVPLCKKCHRGVHSYAKAHRVKLEKAHIAYLAFLKGPKKNKRR